MDISIVIPVLDEEENVSTLYDEIVSVMSSIEGSFEIIMVDDGSSDGTFRNMKEIAARAGARGVDLICLKHRRNFGKATALNTGFQRAKGEVIVTMDGDLQDDPAEIPKLLKRLDEGFDMVSGWKVNRQDPIGKTMPSKFFNFVTSKFVDGDIHDINCGFKAYRKDVIRNIHLYGERHRFIPVLVSQAGFSVGEVPVNHRPRIHGVSKYGLDRLFAVHDLITILFLGKYLKKPLHFMGNLGLAAGSLGFFIIFFLYVRKFLFGVYIVKNQFLFFLGILSMIIGVQFFCMGLLGELMIRLSPSRGEEDNVSEEMSSR